MPNPSDEMMRDWPLPPSEPSTAQSFGGKRVELDGRDVDGFLDVREQVVAVDEDGVAPLVGEVERELGELDRLADVHRREDDVAVVAVAAAPGRLVVVLLAAGHVEDHERQLGERDLRERLLHEREALAGRAGRRPGAGRQRTPGHPDGFELALGVDADAALFGQALGEVLEQLGERRHGVAGEELAARGN